jgi:hypothetical protein
LIDGGDKDGQIVVMGESVYIQYQKLQVKLFAVPSDIMCCGGLFHST